MVGSHRGSDQFDMPETPSPFGERLRRLREAAALTQEELAERAGLTAQAVGALETGKRRRPYPTTVRAIADALGLSAAERAGLAASVAHRSQPPSAPVSTDLPVASSDLIARESERAEVAAILRGQRSRLVTLTGPGGVGKTSLALAIAAGVTADFPDGITFVDLAPVSSADQVAPAIAQTLGIPQSGSRTVVDAIRTHLRDRRFLLLIDNAEHVLDAAPDIAALLASGPNLALLVTSRAPIRVRGEYEYPVLPLALPDLGRVPTPEEVLEAPAARLFVERARAAAPAFTVTPANAAAVAAICRRLDGLPLALELAAPWIKLLPPTALLARLDRTLPLLGGGPRDLPTRQQTMRDTIAWSYELLPPVTQQLFRRLSVFVGGFTLTAAEAVAGSQAGPGLDGQAPVGDPAVLAGLALLVERSLVRQEIDAAGSPRFALFETIREFGLDQLAASGEEQAIRAAHAAWATDVALDSASRLKLRLDSEVLTSVETELANLRAAMAWMEASNHPDGLIKLAGASIWPWYLTGQLREGRYWAERALAAAPDAAVPDLAVTTFAAGHLAHYLGDDAAAIPRLEQAVKLSRRAGDAWHESFSLLILGIVAEDTGDYRRAKQFFAAAHDVSSRANHQRGVGLALFHLGIVAYGAGDLVRATAYEEESLALGKAIDDPLLQAWSFEWLGVLASERGDLPAAAVAIRHRLAIPVGPRPIPSDGQLVAAIAVIGAASGSVEAAARLFGAHAALLDASGESTWLPERDVYERAVARLREALGDDRYDRLVATGRVMPDQAIVADFEAIIDGASA
jgi:predicted ATPase/DNA-binding XRE family transcriptional regulator